MINNEQIEHVARRAAELGDTEVEGLCDSVLAGDTEAQLVANIVAEDDRYAEWMQRGEAQGWEVRS